MLIGRWIAMPWCSTSHGALPSVARIIIAEREAVERQPERELGEPTRQPAGPQLGDRAEPGELAHPAAGASPGLEGRRRWSWRQSTSNWSGRK